MAARETNGVDDDEFAKEGIRWFRDKFLGFLDAERAAVDTQMTWLVGTMGVDPASLGLSYADTAYVNLKYAFDKLNDAYEWVDEEIRN